MKRPVLLLLLPVLLSALACASIELPVPGRMSAALPGTIAPSPEPFPTPTPTSRQPCVVNTDTLNLRACAGTHCTTLAWLARGETLILLDAQDPWLHVESQSHGRGWVHSKFCSGENQP